LIGIPHAFAHTWENCYAMHLSTGNKTYLYTFELDGTRIVCPVSERQFRGKIDIVTPYGFSGFTGSKPLPGFSEYFRKFAANKGYVCGYIGMNPLLQNEKFCRSEEIYYYNSLYALDLTIGIEELYSRLSTNRKRQVKAAGNFENIISEKYRLLDFLLQYYRAFYAKKGASSVYQFDPRTLIELVKNDNVLLAGTIGENGVNAVIMFAYTPYIGEYILNVSLPDGQQNSVALLWYGICQLKKRNVRWLNLGGGIKPGDGVAQFKKRFGGEVFPLSSVKQIYHDDIYHSLCKSVNADPTDMTGYFPSYRSPNKAADN